MPKTYLLLLLAMVSSCGGETCRETPVHEELVNLEVERSERELFQAARVDDVSDFFEAHPVIANQFFHADQYADREAFHRKVLGLIQDPFIDTLYREASDAFSDREWLNTLSVLYTGYNRYYPQKNLPKVSTVVSGLYNDLYISDKDLIIGLDFFIGPQATYKPLNVPVYIRRRYTKNHLPVIIAKFLAGSHVKTGEENTLLSEMIYQGKVNYLVSRLLPCTADSVIMGYTPAEMDGVKYNREQLWGHFIDNELLYETGEFTKQKYVGERPNIYEISQKCPGRVGAWLGWEIVEEYMRNNSVSLQELMEENPHKIFAESGYKPAAG